MSSGFQDPRRNCLRIRLRDPLRIVLQVSPCSFSGYRFGGFHTMRYNCDYMAYTAHFSEACQGFENSPYKKRPHTGRDSFNMDI